MAKEEGCSQEAAAGTAQRVAKLIGATVEPQARLALLVSLVEAHAAGHLPWLVHVFEWLRLQRQVSLPPSHQLGVQCLRWHLWLPVVPVLSSVVLAGCVVSVVFRWYLCCVASRRCSFGVE